MITMSCYIRIILIHISSLFFFLNDPAPPKIYPLPLHAALPIKKNPTSPPGASPEPPGQQQPGGSPQATAPAAGSGKPTGTPVPDVTGSTGATQPESVQSALTNFRRDLTVDDALRLLDALRGEQRGLPAVLEGTGVRRGGNVDVPY